MLKVARKISELGFDGSPDLVLYHSNRLIFVEVKSASDALRPNQITMLRELSSCDPCVSCHLCCPASARKRFAAVMESALQRDSSSDEEAKKEAA